MRKAPLEDYLRTMYHLYEKNKYIKSVDIAKQLRISKPSVSEMLKKLAKKGLIKFKPYSNILLTTKGFIEARKVMHNHRVIEVFLRDTLNYDIGKVHKEAHRMEHVFSKESIERLDKFLGHPKLSPKGMKIPHNRKAII